MVPPHDLSAHVIVIVIVIVHRFTPFFFPDFGFGRLTRPVSAHVVRKPFRLHHAQQSHPLSQHPAPSKTFVGDQHQCSTGTCEFFLFCWLAGGEHRTDVCRRQPARASSQQVCQRAASVRPSVHRMFAKKNRLPARQDRRAVRRGLTPARDDDGRSITIQSAVALVQ